MSDKLTHLQQFNSLADLAYMLGYQSKGLSSIIYAKDIETEYKVFHLVKRDGTLREIKAPGPKLKRLQKKLADLLYACFDEINQKTLDDKKSINSVSFGFRRSFISKDKKTKKSYTIADNAAHHKNRRWVLNLDLKHFFPSFNFGRVRGFFIKDKKFQLQPKIATLIAQIACHENSLPQGSPCSPIISLLIGQILDMHLVRLAKKYRVKYTRYADDITFSTN